MDSAEEQLNKLITAYNRSNEFDEDEMFENSMNASMALDHFDRMNKKRSASDDEDDDRVRLASYAKPEGPPAEKKTGLAKPAPRDQAKLDQLLPQIEALKKELKDTQPAPLEKRFLELTQKNKGLNVQLEKEKTISSELRAQVEALRVQLAAQQRPPEEPVKKPTIDPKLEEKIIERNFKISVLEMENQKLVRALKREVGDFKTVDEVLKDEAGAKSRAIQVEALKAKIALMQSDTNSENKSVSSFKRKAQQVSDNRTVELEGLRKSEAVAVDLSERRAGGSERQIQGFGVANGDSGGTASGREDRVRAEQANSRREVEA